ncbi:hypothetical protein EGR_08984 [Echinococcus granulosus]|uniref:Uncharacterized protein n=1 Tax=Echinococcus granulosus TaxID=6210 RepID=W6URY1_ECHGR|nr:hypothetical protein EGR_08984 [Echinococcus granulosus]EUB56179.1 hypothetical protein EGR_08984 [Echinococcus granulosus]
MGAGGAETAARAEAGEAFGNPNLSMQCSTWEKAVEVKVFDICHHRQRNIYLQRAKKTNEEVFAALEDTVLDLRMAESKSLNAAGAKLEMVSMTGDKMMCPLVWRITNVPVGVHKTQDVSA